MVQAFNLWDQKYDTKTCSMFMQLLLGTAHVVSHAAPASSHIQPAQVHVTLEQHMLFDANISGYLQIFCTPQITQQLQRWNDLSNSIYFPGLSTSRANFKQVLVY